MNIAIAGTGYVGLVTGVCLASKGHKVVCVDVSDARITSLQAGQAPFYEIGLNEMMQAQCSRLSYTTEGEEAYRHSDMIFICVGTPERRDGSANLQYVYKAAEQIADSIESDCIIVLKSTVPVGTGDKVEAYIRERVKTGVQIHVVSNPEFLSQGSAIRNMLHAERLIIGSEDDFVREQMMRVYEGFEGERVCTDRRSAEMIKYASNDFLALKISYINEIANLCELIDADIEDVTYGMGLDSRIGNQFMKAGIGYGGSCFPKDTKALNWLAIFNDREIKTVKAAIEVNEQQKLRLIKKAKKYYKSFSGLQIAVLGLTFKPGTDDLREAPSLVNIPWLLEEGACIKAWDPIGSQNFCDKIKGNISYCEKIEDALLDTELCFIFTEWAQIKAMQPDMFIRYMKTPIILDGRNCFSPEQFQGEKVIYDSVGRTPVLGL